MSNKHIHIKHFRVLYNALSKDRKILILKLFILMIVGGVSEIVSLGMIFPFLAILIDPMQASEMPLIQWLFNVLNSNPEESVHKITAIFLVVIVFSNIIRFLLIKTTIRFNFEAGHELSVDIYRKSLYRDYQKHLNSSSSEIIGGLNKLESLVWVILSVIHSVSGIVMIFFIVGAFIFVDTLLTIAILLGLLSVYILFSKISKNRLSQSSKAISESGNKRIQSVQEGLGSIRDILINYDQKLFIDSFSKIDWKLRSSQIGNNVIAPMPRFVVESIFMVFIVLFAYISTYENGGTSYVIPTLGVLVASLQRLIPLSQQVYFGWSQLNGNKDILQDVSQLVEKEYIKPTDKGKKIKFDKYIEFDNVSFKYEKGANPIISDASFTIAKGSRVGFIGETGSGKSTVVDLLLSILQPTSGAIYIDSTILDSNYFYSWRSNIAHVPQSVYLIDGSFIDNIAFGVNCKDVDLDLVIRSAEKAKISDFINTSSNGYNTNIGENGSLLSGGQVQRIGIARALYKKPSVLIFDEATSALDNKTQSKIVEEINNIDKEVTIIIITHDLSTLNFVDDIYKLEDGCIVKQ